MQLSFDKTPLFVKKVTLAMNSMLPDIDKKPLVQGKETLHQSNGRRSAMKKRKREASKTHSSRSKRHSQHSKALLRHKMVLVQNKMTILQDSTQLSRATAVRTTWRRSRGRTSVSP
jgi:hypothetical protein